MVQIERFLKRTNDFQGDRHLPLLNSLFIERFSEFSPYAQDNNFKTFMKWARRSPQVMGLASIIATDILSDQITFTPVNKGESGRNRVLKAKVFWESNLGMQVAEEMIYDLLFLGIGYNWLGVIKDPELKEVLGAISRELGPDLEKKELEMKTQMIFDAVKKDNPASLVKKLRHVAASTMSIHTDEYNVLKYIQRVGVHTKEFTPEEIITFKLMPLDGRVFPYPPMEAILSEVYLLWLITQNYVSFFENGGQPDNVFILPKELAGSKNHAYLIDTLKKYKKVENKHGNLVFTGDLTIEQLGAVEKQMENKDLGLYVVGVLAMFYGMPVSRIPFLVGKAASGGDAGGLADSGYWRKVSVWQSKIEAPYNAQLFVPYFGVEMKFNRGYLQDEVRETQNEMQRTSVAEQRLRLGLWTIEAAARYLGIDEGTLADAQRQKKERDAEAMQQEVEKSGMLRQKLDNDGNVIRNQDARVKAKQKQDTQLDNQAKAGGKKINP